MNDPADIELFLEAIRLPLGERGAYLERTCADDNELRQRIEVLLLAHEKAGDFLSEAPAGVPKRNDVTIGLQENCQIGRYKILREIGEGGCGVVFMAEQQEPVRRRVALKVVKPGMDTKNVVARFEAERQALALMDHPNIAHVFDAGATDNGRPYFVMELVQGLKITDFCDHNCATTRTRLELFSNVCEAIEHAHDKGVIHRDLKPSNIMVTASADGKPMPKVIDFGIAKAITGQPLTDKTLFTALELLMGTPAYMSPEQAALAEVDVRSDVYSLGVLLYELLTGTTPFDTQKLLKLGVDEVRRVIREEEPIRPSARLGELGPEALVSVSASRQIETSKLSRQLRGDLDWIVMKALEKDPARRYQTANDFGKDIQRYLAEEPVQARPPSGVYRLRKCVVRNQLKVASVCLVLVSLVVGLCVALAVSNREKRKLHRDQLAQWALVDSLRQSMTSPGAKTPAAVPNFSAAPLQTDLANHPEALDQLFTRAEAFARHGLWSEAETEAELVLRFRTNTSDAYHLVVPLLLITDSREKYASLREKILARFGGTSNAYVADRMAKDCLALPEQGTNLYRFAAMADFAATCPTIKNAMFEFSEALAEYRRGKFQSAAKWAGPYTNDGYLPLRCECLVIVAMSQWRMDLHGEACKTLSVATSLVRQHIPQPEGTDLGFDWREWIIADTLLKEATNLISPASTPSSKRNSSHERSSTNSGSP